SRPARPPRGPAAPGPARSRAEPPRARLAPRQRAERWARGARPAASQWHRPGAPRPGRPHRPRPRAAAWRQAPRPAAPPSGLRYSDCTAPARLPAGRDPGRPGTCSSIEGTGRSSRAGRLRLSGAARGYGRDRDIPPSVHGVDRARQRLRVRLHLGRDLAHAGRVRVAPVLVRRDPDRDRHEWALEDVAAPVRAEEVAEAPVLLLVLVRDQLVEDLDDLLAADPHPLERHVEDEVIPPDVPHEARGR